MTKESKLMTKGLSRRQVLATGAAAAGAAYLGGKAPGGHVMHVICFALVCVGTSAIHEDARGIIL